MEFSKEDTIRCEMNRYLSQNTVYCEKVWYNGILKFDDAMQNAGIDWGNGIFESSRTCIKLLRWEPGGFVLFSQHLKKGTYARPADTRCDVVLSWAEVVLMIEAVAARGS